VDGVASFAGSIVTNGRDQQVNGVGTDIERC
jgi:hypothetical protein